ncbi:MAG: leucine-rich repeat domain-containing protein [Kiritimatiellaeota bacterium]|nr:leucine-rich repeat domain-containing protein [Kiritimatiellota bacterium]
MNTKSRIRAALARRFTQWAAAIALLGAATGALAQGTWDQYRNQSWPETGKRLGSAGAGNPGYAISSPGDLAQFAYIVSTGAGAVNAVMAADGCDSTFAGKTVQVSGNLNMGSFEWVPVGDSAHGYANPFRGTFDGNLKTITGITVQASANNAETITTGFFAMLGDRAVVKNVKLATLNITVDVNSVTDAATLRMGGIVGAVATGARALIDNCSVLSGDIKADLFVNFNDVNSGLVCLGGIAGVNVGANQSDFTMIRNCSNFATLTAIVNPGAQDTRLNVGGIVGRNNGGRILNCHNAGEITTTGTTDNEVFVGGIMGMAGSYSDIVNCLGNGVINIMGTNNGDIQAGGLLGKPLAIPLHIVRSTWSRSAAPFPAHGSGAYVNDYYVNDNIDIVYVRDHNVFAAYPYETVTLTVYGVNNDCVKWVQAIPPYLDHDSVKDTWAKARDLDWPNIGGDYGHVSADGNTVFITTPAQLAQLAHYASYGYGCTSVRAGGSGTWSMGVGFAGKTVKVMKNLDLSGREWVPIGVINNAPTSGFRGTFDGNRKTISNMTIHEDDLDYNAYVNSLLTYGLFGGLRDYNGPIVIKDVVLANVDMDIAVAAGAGMNTYYAGGIVGNISAQDALIENCVVASGTIKMWGLSENNHSPCYMGGIAGACGFGTYTIRNCSNFAALEAQSEVINYGTIIVGGIIGEIGSAKVHNCLNAGNLLLTSAGNTHGYVGGIVGSLGGSAISEVINCLNTGTIQGPVLGGGYQFYGGVIGVILEGGDQCTVDYAYWRYGHSSGFGAGNNGVYPSNVIYPVTGSAPNGSHATVSINANTYTGLYNASTGNGSLNAWVDFNNGSGDYLRWTTTLPPGMPSNNGWPVLDYPSPAPAHSNWRLDSAKQYMEHYDANGVYDDWRLKVAVDGTNVTITVQDGSNGNVLPTAGFDGVVPLADPIYDEDWDTLHILVRIDGESGWNGPFSLNYGTIAANEFLSLELPDTLAHIGDEAFQGFSSLVDLPYGLPAALTNIGCGAFAFWTSFDQPVTIPEGVTEICGEAFRDWTSFNSSFTLPSGLTTIGLCAFLHWDSFNQNFVIPNSVTTIGEFAFASWWNFNQPFEIPLGVTQIDSEAFGYWSSYDKPFIVPPSVTTMGWGVFEDCLLSPYIYFPSVNDLGAIYPGGYPGGILVSTPPQHMTSTFTTWIEYHNAESWATGTGENLSDILGGTVTLGGHPLRTVNQFITLDLNGGEWGGLNQAGYRGVYYDNYLWKSPALIEMFRTVKPPEGHVFLGWYTAPSGGTKFVRDTVTIVEDDGRPYTYYVANPSDIKDYTLYARYVPAAEGGIVVPDLSSPGEDDFFVITPGTGDDPNLPKELDETDPLYQDGGHLVEVQPGNEIEHHPDSEGGADDTFTVPELPGYPWPDNRYIFDPSEPGIWVIEDDGNGNVTTNALINVPDGTVDIFDPGTGDKKEFWVPDPANPGHYFVFDYDDDTWDFPSKYQDTPVGGEYGDNLVDVTPGTGIGHTKPGIPGYPFEVAPVPGFPPYDEGTGQGYDYVFVPDLGKVIIIDPDTDEVVAIIDVPTGNVTITGEEWVPVTDIYVAGGNALLTLDDATVATRLGTTAFTYVIYASTDVSLPFSAWAEHTEVTHFSVARGGVAHVATFATNDEAKMFFKVKAVKTKAP